MKTKTEYICETCGKHFATKEEATSCETAHELEKKKDDLKAKSAAAIGEMIEKHVKTFGEFPNVTVSGETTKFMLEEFFKLFPSVIDCLFN